MKIKYLLPLMAIHSPGSDAVEWLFKPNLTIDERYTDNLRMQIPATRDNFITTISPETLLGYITENQTLKANFRWNELIYDESQLDFSEKIGTISHQFIGERFKTDIDGQYAEQSSINTQLGVSGSGDLEAQVPQTTRAISPSVTYNLTEKNAIQLGYSYLDVTFDSAPNLGYSDYDNQQYTATLIHNYSDRLSFNLTGAYSDFNSSYDLLTNISGTAQKIIANTVTASTLFDQSGSTSYQQKSTSLLYQAGLQYLFDEKTQFSVSAGMRDTENTTRQSTTTTVVYNPEILGDFENSSQDTELYDTSNTSGHIFSANLSRKTEWGNFAVNAGQQLNPSSSGTQQQSTTFSGKVFYALDERWTTGLDATYLTTESTSGSESFGINQESNNRTYITISPNLRWSWTPEVNLVLTYSYRQQDYDSTNQSAVSNNLQLTFSYQPQINRQVK